MKCPHCLVSFHEQDNHQPLVQDTRGMWLARFSLCPACKKIVVFLVCHKNSVTGAYGTKSSAEPVARLVEPKGSSRPPCPTEVPDYIAEDYNEACLVLEDSPKASAALSRRCLQAVLRHNGKVKHGDLINEIEEAAAKGLPSHLSEALHALRNIGNFAAHPMKSKATGEILPVEKGEAEWNLDTLEGLLDFYFVQPAASAARKAALNKKLIEGGKKTI